MLPDKAIDNLLTQLGMKAKQFPLWREIVRVWLIQNDVCHLDDVEIVAVEIRRKRI